MALSLELDVQANPPLTVYSMIQSQMGRGEIVTLKKNNFDMK